MFFALACALLNPIAVGSEVQRTVDAPAILQALDAKGSVRLDNWKVQVLAADFRQGGKNVEAVLFRPLSNGPHPAVLVIPGYTRTARDYIPFAVPLASEGFVVLSITQPGWGKSEGKADFVGPNTMNVVEAAFERLRLESGVDPKRVGVFGYSRGAMAASLLTTQSPNVAAGAFFAGIYDFRRAYDDVKSAMIRGNMKAEAGLSDENVRVRSSILFADKIQCPVLIVHGEEDLNAPVSQAKLMDARLTELKKPHELKLISKAEHALGMPRTVELALEFFKKQLLPKGS